MTESERRTIRELISQRVREVVAPEQGCAGCGCHMDERSAGCRSCTNRWLRRKWREDEQYRENERLYDRYRKSLRKNRKEMAA